MRYLTEEEYRQELLNDATEKLLSKRGLALHIQEHLTSLSPENCRPVWKDSSDAFVAVAENIIAPIFREAADTLGAAGFSAETRIVKEVIGGNWDT
jgi:hypothetical protein